MKQIHKTVPLPDDMYIRRYFLESYAFFDIETTGFSKKTSFVYLIGMAVRTQNSIQITQFLAENRREEAEIIDAFFKALRPFQTLVSFNGLNFDLPFLKSRGLFHKQSDDWDSFDFFDLYKLTGKLANLFQLPDKKQKSVEKFLGVGRDDLLSGGELIPVYCAYEKQRDSHLEHLLLLHNYEDVLGMTKLLSLLSYRDFFEKPADVVSVSRETNLPFGSAEKSFELLFTLNAPMPFPQKFLFQSDVCSLMCSASSAKLLVKIFCGELKYYYDNYKDYYYLPDEDMAVHKSVAAFVDAAHKKKAAAATCYTRKCGEFLPQEKGLFTPEFYPDNKSGVSYFELTDDFLADADALRRYAGWLLNYCTSNKLTVKKNNGNQISVGYSP